MKIKKIKKQKYIKIIIKLKIIHEKMSQCVKKEFFGAVVADCFDEVKYYLLKRNLMINYEEIEEKKIYKKF